MSELDVEQIRAEARGYSEELAEWRRERDALQAEVDLLKRDNLLLRDERDGEVESRNDLQDEVAELRKDKARLEFIMDYRACLWNTDLRDRASIDKQMRDRAMEGAKP